MGMQERMKLRIGFVHPDLGIGGAERLVVDAAVAVQKRGADVTIFTSRHDPKRCFEETKDGTLKVSVLGSSLPQRLHAKVPLTILFSIMKSLLLTFLIITSTWLPEPAGFFNPLSRLQPFDVFFVDQQSVCVPFLRFFLGTRVVFYCHFPDKLLSGGWEVSVDAKGAGTVQRGRTGLLKRVYRWPIDKLEEWSTGQSDVILANSHFSARVYARAFPSLAKRVPKVVYPCIDVSTYQAAKGKGKGRQEEGDSFIASDRPTLISLNRFEAKKDVALAIRTFSLVLKKRPKGDTDGLRLIIAGGYDSALPDNIETLASLQQLADDLELSHHTVQNGSDAPPADAQVLFLLNFSTAQRTHLLTSPSTRALLYTPANEHFGIVPVEAMACGVPVLAADSGGPTESVVDLDLYEEPLASPQPRIGNKLGTGLLRDPSPSQWSTALQQLLDLGEDDRRLIAANGKERVQKHFSASTLGRQVEDACREALEMGDLHSQLGDKLIWGSAALIAFAVVNMGLLIAFHSYRAT